MRNQNKVFHLAIPCKDLDETVDFYNRQLGCKLCRRYDDRVTIDFFGDQLVCHLNPDEIDQNPKMYPRHFGITYVDKNEFDQLYKLAKDRDIKFFKDRFARFAGKIEEHETFFLQDPSNNLLEFKYYTDPRMIY